MIILKLIQCFSNRFIGNNLFENLTHFESKFEIEAIVCPSEEVLMPLITQIPSRDEWTIEIKLEYSEVLKFNKATQIADFLRSLQNLINAKESEESVTITCNIDKGSDTFSSIFDFDAFSSYLTTRNFTEILDTFKVLFSKDCYSFEVFTDGFRPFNTKNIYFVQNGATTQNISIEKRNQTSERLKSITHFGGGSIYNFLPEDFKLQFRVEEYDSLNSVFDRLCLIFCIISIFDITTLHDEGISYKLKGYKFFEGLLKYEALDTSSIDEYYRIYSWLIDGGNITDKVGLAKNILSIHIVDKNKAENLTGSPFNSIESGYEIYLKDNIKQYIEVRNKISDQLLEFNKRATSIIDNFALGFQRSALSLVTLYSSILVIKVLSNSSLSVLYNDHAAILSFTFIAISICYLYISRSDVKSQRARFIESYNNLKLRYTDLLTVPDIDKILKADLDHKSDLKFIDEKLKRYTHLWWAVIGLISFVAIFFYYSSSKFIAISDFIYIISTLVN